MSLDATIDIGRGPGGGVLHVEVTVGEQSVWFAGYCWYWYDSTVPIVGGFGCAEHPEKPVAYRWDGERFVKTNDHPPIDIDIHEGEWLSDEDWKAYCERTR